MTKRVRDDERARTAPQTFAPLAEGVRQAQLRPLQLVVRFAPVVLCLVAFALGVVGLDARSLWGDEAFSVWASRQPVLTLMAGLDAQPPLYHLALGLGRALWGESVFAIRFVSLGAGVLLAAVAARLGRSVAGRRSAAVCALVIATSPLVIYFEQEARMYTLAALLAALAMLVAARILRRRGGRVPVSWWAVYALASTGALFTHYYAVGVLLVNSLALFVAALRTRNPRRIVAWLAAHLVIAIVFGAWFFGLQFRLLGRSAAGRSRLIPPVEDMLTNISRGVNGLIFGMRADPGLTPLALILFAMALLGALGLWRKRRTRPFALLAPAWALVSMALVALTAATSGIVPDFNPRYYIFILLPLVVSIVGWTRSEGKAVRIEAVRTSAQLPASNVLFALLPVVLVLAPAVYGDAALFDRLWAKSGYAALMQTLRERAAQGDGTVLMNSDQFPLYDYYGPGGTDVWIVRNDMLGASGAAELDRQYDEFMRGKARVWIINYGWAAMLSPRPRVEQRLAAAGVRIYHQSREDATLSLYQLQGATDALPVEPAGVVFGGQIQLTGARWREPREGHLPGDAITLDLLWRAERKITADYTVFMHLRRVADGAQVAAFDSPPVNGAAPTRSWQPGSIITDTRGIALPDDAAPGAYEVVIGWYQYPSFERLSIDGQTTTEYVVGTVQVGSR